MNRSTIPLLDLKAHHEPIRENILAAIEKVIDSQAFIMGPEVKTLEDRIAAYSGTKHAIGVSSGTDALLIALMALGVGPGDEVVVPDYSFFATVGAVTRVGAKPVFVDIDLATFNISATSIEKAITPRTKAIIPVHLFGQCADMGPILETTKRHGLKVIEDAAQAIGAEYKDGRRAGAMGDIGCFSFFPSKNLGGFGDGGMVVTNHGELAEKIRVLRVHGAKPKYYHQVIGGNFRLDTIQAAVLNVKLDYLDGWTRKRQENAAAYRKRFLESGLTDQGVILPEAVYEGSGAKHHHIYNQFCIRAPQRNQLREHLQGQAIGCEVYYPVPFHVQDCFRNLSYAKNDFPKSQAAAEQSLALPVYPGLHPNQITRVVETVRTFFRQ